MSKNSAVIAFSVILLLFVVSCNAQINGSIMADGKADMQFYAALEPKMSALLKALAAVGGGTLGQATPILDGPGIGASMASAPGIESIALVNLTPTSIVGPVKISRIGDLLSMRTVTGRTYGSKSVGFIDYQQSTASTQGRCTINLNLESGPEILALISPDIGDYLSALMAPLVTGEKLTKADYLVMVNSVYGKDIAEEMSKTFIHVSVEFPAQVQSVKGGAFSGKRAEFTIPMLDILVLEQPLSYEVIW